MYRFTGTGHRLDAFMCGLHAQPREMSEVPRATALSYTVTELAMDGTFNSFTAFLDRLLCLLRLKP